MSQYQHIQIAGFRRHGDNRLVDVPARPDRPLSKPKAKKDSFWGEEDVPESKSAPAPALQSVKDPSVSLLDAPIDEPVPAAAMLKKAASQLKKLKIQPGASSKGEDHDDEHDSDDDTKSRRTYNSMHSLATTSQRPRPRRMLLHLHPPSVMKQKPRDTRETMDRILTYIDDPPVRRRKVPDEDWSAMPPLALVESLHKYKDLIRYLVEENKKLISQSASITKVTQTRIDPTMVWRDDENLDIVLILEKSKEDTKQLGREELLDNLSIVREAIEDLLDMNDGMVRHIQDARKG